MINFLCQIKILLRSPFANLRTLCPQQKCETKRGNVTGREVQIYLQYWMFPHNAFDCIQ